MSALKKMSAVLVAATAMSLAPMGQAQAALITGVSVSTNMNTTSSSILNNIVNGNGLPLNTPALTGQHANSSVSNAWVSASNSVNRQINFTFDGQYAVTKINVWNLIGTGNTNQFRSDGGVKDVVVSTSQDGINYGVFSGITQFAQGTFNPESFSLVTANSTGGVLAKFIRFTLTNNYGDTNRIGLSEVQFDGVLTQAIPTPALLPGLVGLGMAAARKRRAKGKTIAA
jgi:hypothetical protein